MKKEEITTLVQKISE